MSGTVFPQGNVLTPAGQFSPAWYRLFQNFYQATSGGSAAGLVPSSITVNGHPLSSDVVVTQSDIGLGNVTNDAQTKAAIVPNTVPTAGQVLAGNGGGTAYAAVTVSGDAAMASTGALTVTSINGKAVSLGGALTTLGAFASTFTMTGVTTVTFPTSGTLATVDGNIGAATGTSLAVTGGLTSSGTAGIGYTTGSGGSVVQATSKSTGVTLNAANGQITMNAAALAANATVSFTLTNSSIASSDRLIVHHAFGGTFMAYDVYFQCGTGLAVIGLRNVSAGSLSEAVGIAFAVIKGVNA